MDLVVGLLTHLWQYGQGLLGYVIPFLFVLTLVVFFHELGHFLVARWCGVKVEAFSIGFGRALASWTDRKGTAWKIGWLPLGGYVRFLGDEDVVSRAGTETLSKLERADREHSFHFKPLYQRALIVAAGPVANFILAIVIFALLFMTLGEEMVPAQVEAVQPGSAAAAAGFKPGDVVTSVDGYRIESFGDIQEIVSVSAGDSLDIVVKRDGKLVSLEAVPTTEVVVDRFGNEHRIGRLGLLRENNPDEITYVRYDPFSAVWRGCKRTVFIVDRTLDYIGGLFVGTEDVSQLSGPLGIAKVSGEIARLGFAALVNLAAVLSISIGLLNLFPIPMLDGGHLLYYAVEAVRGRPLGEKAQELGFRLGLALVLSLMLFATWNDLAKLQIFG
jgi:regulator of sigma E protease